MKKFICLMLSFALILGLSGCTAESEDLMENITQGTESFFCNLDDQSPVFTDFSLRLFRDSYEQGKNTLISPMSVLYALGMTANGASGETLTQMERVFGMNLDTLNVNLMSINEGLDFLKLANSIWFKDVPNFTVNEDFLQTNADYYGAGIFKTPFDSGTCKEINDWVSEHTDGMVKNILDKIPEEAVMYLVNALAFDAKWEEVYRENAIREGTFTTAKGERRTVEMMYSEESRYLEDSYATGFIKYYEGGRYAFVALLPNEGIALEAYLANLTGEDLYDLLSDPYDAEVLASMPKFQVEYDTEMSDVLKKMGMTDAFDPASADFSRIGSSDVGNLYITRVLHKTQITVDGMGTKAGAATVVEIAPESALGEPDFYVVNLDRPFLYMVIDTYWNMPIFMGTMVDPDLN